jgi:pantoate--beta-alanine ligase
LLSPCDARQCEAVTLTRTFAGVGAELARGRRDWPAMEQTAMQSLAARGWQPDYVAIRRRTDLGTPTQGDTLVVLAAAKLESTRLIDNLELDVPA